MTQVCRSTLLAARFGPATLAAILLAMIAAAADPEGGVAFLPAAKPLAESIFGVGSHSHLKARLDNRQRSCQFMDGYLGNLSTRGFANGPRSPITIGVSSCSTFRKKLHDGWDDVTCACGAMMLRCLNRQVFK